jgi:MobA/VirD2-like, nuclease domain
MPTPSPIAKVSIGKSGYGAAHASYITRLSALDPEGRERAQRIDEWSDQPALFTDDDRGRPEPSVRETVDENLDERTLAQNKEHAGDDRHHVDPVWTWNAPQFLTGEAHGIKPELNPQTARRTEKPARETGEKLTLKEKVQNVKAYFASLEDYERRKGGRTHYRIVLSFDVPATNEQIRDLTNKFLEQAFPKSIGFAAIHRDTDHPHVHLYLNSRQFDGKRIQLKNNEFKTIDEKWATLYAQFAGDKSVYLEYLRKKEETRQWKMAAAEAYRKGEPIPPKPERDSDRRERLGEQRLSAARTQDRDKGKQLDARPHAEPVSRPASEKETSRLLAKQEVAQERLAHLIRTDVPHTEVKSAARIASAFAAALEKTLGARKELGRENPPRVVYTTEEWKQLKEYAASRDLTTKDDRAAARLQASRVIAGAELKDAREKAEAFQVSRHFWKFDVEGWNRGLSLKEIEQAIRTKTAEKFKLYNFLRPSKRQEIGSQIDYLQDVKKDIQKQLAARERSVDRNLGGAEVRHQVASKQVEQTVKARAEQGKEMPAPVHQGDELIRIDSIANRNKDAQLLQYVYSHIRDKVLQSPSRQALSRVKGRAILARLDMLKEAERFSTALKFGDFRQLPLKDGQGLDYTKSLREVSPRNALETIIRHFTDTPEQKREGKELTDSVKRQQERAERQSNNATDFSSVMDKILDDHCRAAGVSADEIAPTLTAPEIAELRDFAEKMPYVSRIRKEFTDAGREAERGLRERELAQAARESEQARAHDPVTRPTEQFPSRPPTTTERPDRDSFSRGR